MSLICKANDTRLADFIFNAIQKDQSIEIKTHRNTRTGNQNRARWLYLQMIADELTERGEMFYPPGFDIEIPFTKDNLYQNVWRTIQIHYFPNKNTLNTSEFSKVADTAAIYFANKHGIDIPFPSIERILDLEYIKEL